MGNMVTLSDISVNKKSRVIDDFCNSSIFIIILLWYRDWSRAGKRKREEQF